LAREEATALRQSLIEEAFGATVASPTTRSAF